MEEWLRQAALLAARLEGLDLDDPKYSQLKGGLERRREFISDTQKTEKFTNLTANKTEGQKRVGKRVLRAQIGSDVEAWFKQSGNEKYLSEFKQYQSQISAIKNQYAQQIKNLLDSDEVHRGHPQSLEGEQGKLTLAQRRKQLSPTTFVSDTGADTEGYPESGAHNRMHQQRNIILRQQLQQLMRPSNQIEAAQNFVLNKTNAKNWTIDQEISEGVKMNKLALGIVSADELELTDLDEAALKKAGFKINNQANRTQLKKLLRTFHVKARKNSMEKEKYKGIWDFKRGTGFKSENEYHALRVHRGQQRARPNTYTVLPSQATGQTVVNRVPPTITNAVALSKQVQGIENELQSDRKVKKNTSKTKFKGKKFGGTGLGSHLTNETDNTFVDPGGYTPPIRYIGKDFDVNL